MKRFLRAFSPRLCLKCSLLLSLTPAAPGLVAAQQPRDTLNVLMRAYDDMLRATRTAAVWPGFKPDTIPVSFVLPTRGQFLVGWRGELPAGFEKTAAPNTGWRAFDARGAASTNVDIEGRSVAQVSVSTLEPTSVAGIATHEAFHVFALLPRTTPTRFGERENSFLVASYPVLNPENDALMALEGRLLADALSEARPDAARALAQQFVAVRAQRHRLLGPSLSDFEDQAEINEGLAEYALLSTENVLSGRAASAAAPNFLADLRAVTTDPVRSFRLRYYKLGPAQAFLLDKLNPAWKTTYLSEKHTFADLLAIASGARAAEDNARAQAERREDISALRAAAATRISNLQSLRRKQIDSLLNRPGTQVVIDLRGLPNRDVGWCGIDPQNLLQAAERVLLHTRFLNACSGRSVSAEFATAVVQDRTAAELRAVVEEELRITAGGAAVTIGAEPKELTDVRIESPTFNARFAKAVLRRTGRFLYIEPRI